MTITNPHSEFDQIKYLILTEIDQIYKVVKASYNISEQMDFVEKPDRTPVSIADLLIEMKIKMRLNELFPDDGFIGEEGLNQVEDLQELKNLLAQKPELAEIYNDDVKRFEEMLQKQKTRDVRPQHRWLVDPIDGTAEFVVGNKRYGFLLARETWSKEFNEYRADHGVIYAPEYELNYKGNVIKGPLAETLEIDGELRVILSETTSDGELNLVSDNLRFDREEDDPLNNWKVILRDSPVKRQAENPYRDAFRERYGDNVIGDWESTGIGFLELVVGNVAAYHSEMDAWDHTGGRLFVEIAGGENFRVVNDGNLEVIASRGGPHSQVVREVLGNGEVFTGHRWGDLPNEENSDSQDLEQPGGIDFNSEIMDLQEKGNGIGFTIDSTMFQSLQADSVEGILPVIINVTPITNFEPLLGLINELEAQQ